MPQSGLGAAAEADASGKQQLKQTQSGSSSAVCTESCPAPDYTRLANEGEVAERAKRAQLLVIYYSYHGTHMMCDNWNERSHLACATV